jgi:uncharacterized repeat protein (TIGR03803 family)
MPKLSPSALTILAVLISASAMIFPGSALAQLNVLWTFSGGSQGATPNALAIGPDGSLYGTAASGGAANMGVVFQLVPTSTGWSENVLYNFTGGRDGSGPNALVFGPDGNLYGTAKNGGNMNCPSGCGTVFQLKPMSGGWALNVVHSFIGRSDGHDPVGVIFDSAGNIYGTTLYGGPSDVGVVYKLTPSSGSAWLETVLYSFTGGKDGSYPNPQLVVDTSGNVFGTTLYGGVAPGLRGFGEAFELSPTSTGWKRTMIAAFIGSGANQPGSYPQFGVISDGAGNLYGVTSGGDGDFGNVYRMEPSPLGGRWQFKVLHFLGTNANGSYPMSLVRDSAGNLYSAGPTGGTGSCPSGCGTLFRLQPTTSLWQLSLLYTFTGGSDGMDPSNLILDNEGNLYGTEPGESGSSGLVFELPAQ